MADNKPIIGWRAWEFLHPHFLADVNKRHIWVPGEKIEARCHLFTGNLLFPTQEHVAPEFRCQCGIHAFKNSGVLGHEIMTGWNFTVPNETRFIGEVSLWGKIIVHRLGYRAQFAYPKRVYVIYPSDEIAASLGWLSYKYRVPFSESSLEELGIMPREVAWDSAVDVRNKYAPRKPTLDIITHHLCGHAVKTAIYTTWKRYYDTGGSTIIESKKVCPKCWIASKRKP